MSGIMVRTVLIASLWIGEAVNFEIVPGKGAWISNGRVAAGIGGGGFFLSHTTVTFHEVTPESHCSDACFEGTDESRYCSSICRPATLDGHVHCYRKCMCEKVEPQFQCIAEHCGAVEPRAKATHYCRWWSGQMKRYVEGNGYAKTCTCEVDGVEPAPYPDEL